MNLPHYPKYKPSGVEWLGDVPEHWEVMRLRTTTENVIDQTNQKADWEIYIALEHVESWTGRIHEYDSDVVFESQVKKFRFNDVLFGKLRPYLAKIARPSTNGVCVGEFLVLRPRNGELTPNYLEYLLRSKPMIDLISASTFGAKMPRTDWQFIGKLLHPLPPLSEQIYISDFLDRKTEKIETLIDKNQMLVERLKEKRTALITRTVTRSLPPDAARAAGLDPYPKLKPSGVGWIGDIPAHWNIVSISRISEVIQTGPFGSQLHAEDYTEGGVPIINPSHIIANHIVPNDKFTIDESTAQRLIRHKFRIGDIVMARRGEIGRCGVVSSKEAGWICGTGSLIIRLKECDASYYAVIFSDSSFSRFLNLHAIGTTMDNMNPAIVGKMLVPAPSLHEQTTISNFLDRETENIDNLIGNIETFIERLREYRSAIIDAAVTGKIDAKTVDTRENAPSHSRSQWEEPT